MNPVALLITHRTRPGQRDAVRAVWERHMAPAISANPGHVAYSYCWDETDPDVIVAFQLYRDADQGAAFVRTPVYVAYEEKVSALLSGAPTVQRLTPLWTKNSDAAG